MMPVSAPQRATDGLANDLAAALDPVVFARRAGIEPDAWQADVLRSTATHHLLCCSRQSGKSTVSAIVAMHQALYVPGSLILVLAPVGRQSKELLAKVRQVYGAGAPDMPAEVDNKVEIELENGSRIVVIPDKEANIRGFSAPAMLIIDEAAWVMDSSYQALRPMLAVSQGRILLLSTPNGKRGFFHFEWTEGGSAWHRSMITADRCPRIDPAWLAEERQKIPGVIFDQEYLCRFTENEDSVFHYDDIRSAVTGDVKPLFARKVA